MSEPAPKPPRDVRPALLATLLGLVAAGDAVVAFVRRGTVVAPAIELALGVALVAVGLGLRRGDAVRRLVAMGLAVALAALGGVRLTTGEPLLPAGLVSMLALALAMGIRPTPAGPVGRREKAPARGRTPSA